MKRKLDDQGKQYLEEKLGDYLSASELRRKGISLHTLNMWREHGFLDSVSLNGTWYYSLVSINIAIHKADIKDIRDNVKPKRKRHVLPETPSRTPRHIPWP